ncbi:MAG: aminotransferase class I and II [Gemmatimonadota bacterium]|nr:aminotransferase class I and II [Gemmatimonadota bacterium]
MQVFTAARYVQPLREGGSLPAVVDTDGGGLFVAKFRGAGQGVKALIAEIIAGLLAIELGLPVPELALIDVPESFGKSEPDPEIQDLLRASHGINFGMRYLDGAFNFDVSAAGELISPDLAARIVWLDAFLSNPDRTHRNPNLLIWNREPWLIDHGAALYVHHDWPAVDDAKTRAPFPLIRSHVLLSASGEIDEADAESADKLGDDVIERVVAAVPDAMLTDASVVADFASVTSARERYVDYLTTRLQSPRAFVEESIAARDRASRSAPIRLAARR